MQTSCTQNTKLELHDKEGLLDQIYFPIKVKPNNYISQEIFHNFCPKNKCKTILKVAALSGYF